MSDKDRTSFEASHVYSSAPEAARKRALDEKIMGGDFAKGSLIDKHDEAYLKALIKLSSNDRLNVSTSARGLQFFIIKGGGEGFLDAAYKGVNASYVLSAEVTTSGEPGTTMIFDNNDLLVAFDRRGGLIGSALLARPISISTRDDPWLWTERTANAVYNAWDGQPVSIYENTYFFKKYNGIRYYGLVVNDSLGYYSSGKVRVDLHKEEATNGCIFIIDEHTPDLSDKDKLNAFEPQFIRDVQKSIGAKEKWNIGTMRVIEIK